MSSRRIIQQSDAQTSSQAEASGLIAPAATLLDRLRSQITLAGGPHETIAVRAPYTGASIGAIPAGTAADLELAVQRARAAQPAWSRAHLCRPRAHLSALSRPAARAPG